MNSIGGILEGIRESVLFRSFAISGIDVISTANGKAIGGIFEREDKSPGETYTKILHDEGLEPMWATFVSYMLAQLSKTITPWVPEQIVIIPGKLLGEAWHWLITSHQSTDTEKQSKNGNGKADNIPALFWETLVKKPSDLALTLCGLKEDKNNFFRYFLTQIGLFTAGSFAIKNTEENLPGVNISRDESLFLSTLKGIGYTMVEQATYMFSQTIRFYINFKTDFEKSGNRLAKSLANVINERAIPGHILLGISSAVSTRLFGDVIPRTTAAALGEFPMSILNRIINSRRRRATNCKHDTDGNLILQDGKTIPNYRFNTEKGYSAYNKFLDLSDNVLDTIREKGLDLISWIFRKNRSHEEFKQELRDSFLMRVAPEVELAV